MQPCQDSPTPIAPQSDPTASLSPPVAPNSNADTAPSTLAFTLRPDQTSHLYKLRRFPLQTPMADPRPSTQGTQAWSRRLPNSVIERCPNLTDTIQQFLAFLNTSSNVPTQTLAPLLKRPFWAYNNRLRSWELTFSTPQDSFPTLSTALANTFSSTAQLPPAKDHDLFFVDRIFDHSLPQERTLRITRLDPNSDPHKPSDEEELNIRRFFAPLRPEAIFRQASVPREHPDFPFPHDLPKQPHSWAIVLPTAQDCLHALTTLDSSHNLAIPYFSHTQRPGAQPPNEQVPVHFHVTPPLSIRRGPTGALENRGNRCSRCRQTDHQRAQCPGIVTCIASLRHIKSDALRGDILDLLTTTPPAGVPSDHWLRVSPSFSPEGRLLPNLTLHFASEKEMKATLARQQIQIFLPKGTEDPSIIHPTDLGEAPKIIIPLYHSAGCLNCGDPQWHPLQQCPMGSNQHNRTYRPAQARPRANTSSTQPDPTTVPPQQADQPPRPMQPTQHSDPSHPPSIEGDGPPMDSESDPQYPLPQEKSDLLPSREEDHFTPVTTRHTKRPNLRPTPEGIHHPPAPPANRFASLVDLPDSAVDPHLRQASSDHVEQHAPISTSWADDMPSPHPNSAQLAPSQSSPPQPIK